MDFTVDLTHLHPDVRNAIARKVRHEDRARFDLGILEQRKLKQIYDQAAIAGFNTEFGRVNMITSDDQRARFMVKYGHLCWADPDFGKWVLKQPEHADMRVKDVGTRVQSGWTAGQVRKRIKRYG